VATLISFLHLGNPSNAPKALNNVSGSWVSREILALGLYSVGLLAVVVAAWKNWNIENIRLLLVLGSVFGMAFLWMMIRIYMMPTIPAWNSWYTQLSFVSTTLCLGIFSFLFLHHLGFVNLENAVSHTLLVALMVVLFVEIVSGFFHQGQLKKMNTGIDDLKFDQGTFYKVFLSRMVLLILAFLVVFISAFKPGLFPGNGTHVLMYLLSAMVVVQEVLGRLLFYSTYFRTGV
jgi:anaerobic dimethyl sulfoxide reductase subunit C (anchor subunit)